MKERVNRKHPITEKEGDDDMRPKIIKDKSIIISI
jgi:hypothetical protein